MTLKEKIKKHKDKPVSLIFFGSNYLGIELAKILIDQGSLVIALDSIENNKVDTYEDLIENDNFVVVDKLGLNSLKSVLERLDYSFYFSRIINKTKVGTKKFQDEISILEDSMNLSLDKEAKFLLIDSIDIHRRAISDTSSTNTTKTQKSYTVTQQQVYYEKLVLEYVDKYNLVASIVRMGRVYGPDMQMDSGDRLSQLINESITKDKIIIYGDGLEEYYLVYITDAVYALLKAQFSNDSKGKVLSCREESETTELGIVYALIEQGYRAREVSFVDKEIEHLEKDDTESLGIIGWNPKVSLPRGIKIVVDDYLANTKIEVGNDSKEGINKEEEKIEIKTDQKNESEMIMEVMSNSYKKDALDASVKGKSEDKRLKRVVGFNKKKKSEDKTVQIKAQKRKDKTTNKGKFKTVLKVFGIVVLFAVYLFFFAPLIKASFNSLLTNRLFNSLEYNIENNRVEDAISTIDSLQTSLESAQKSIGALNMVNVNSIVPIDKIFATDEEINIILQALENIKNSLKYEKMLEVYALESSLNLNNESNSEDGIEITQTGTLDIDSLVQNPTGVVNDYKSKIAELKSLGTTKLKANFLLEDLVLNKLEITSNKFKISESLLGIDGESNSMILLVDDSKSSILGGDARAYALITMIDSKLSSIEVNSIENILLEKQNQKGEKDVNAVETEATGEDNGDTTTTEEANVEIDDASINYKNYELSLDSLITKISSDNKPVNMEKVDNVLVLNILSVEKIIKELGSVELGESTITDKNLEDYINDENFEGILRALIIKIITLDNESRNKVIQQIYTDIKNGEIQILSPVRDYLFDTRMLKAQDVRIRSTELPIMEYKGKLLEKERFLELTVQDKKLVGKYTIDFKVDDKASFKQLISLRFPENTVVKATKGMQNPVTNIDETEVVVNGLIAGDVDKTTVSPEIEFEIPTSSDDILLSIENSPNHSKDSISVVVKQDEASNYKSSVLVKTDNALSTTRKFLGIFNFDLSL